MIEIPLSQGLVALVDEADFPKVCGMRWHAKGSGKGRYGYRAEHSYRCQRTGKNVNVLMHRLLMDAQPGQIVDHANGNPLDNRRSNLRFATASQNCANKKPTGASRYMGVMRSGKNWCARIEPGRLAVSLGTWPTEELAAAAYNRAARVVHCGIARFNDVPDLTDEQWHEAVIKPKQQSIEQAMKQLAALKEAA